MQLDLARDRERLVFVFVICVTVRFMLKIEHASLVNVYLSLWMDGLV